MRIEQELTKLYYTIGEVSDMFGVNASTLRFWETEFSKLKPQKNRRGDRKYTEKDIRTLERIYTLVKERGFTIEGAKKEMRNKKGNAMSQSKEALIQKLEGIKAGLTQIRSKL